jgi:hypothetical protein
MNIYTLYVKTHRKTGLKYLGQTSQDPFKYPGSGVDWKDHLKQFGKDIDTAILLQTTDKEERNRRGRYFSALWHVVTASDDFGNKLWANKIPETGGGPGGKQGPNEKMRADALERVANGTNPFCGGHLGRQINQSRIADGTHHFFDSEIQSQVNLTRIKNGTHNFVGDGAPSKQRWTCKNCGVSGQGKGNFTRWHNNGKCSETSLT